MTAPLFNLPITSPLTGPSTASPGQEPAMGGFEALLAAFFGAPGEATPDGPLGEAQSSDKDTGAQPVTADGQTTPAPSPEAQALAAMLAVPAAAAVTPAPVGTAEGEDETARAAASSAPSPPVPFSPPGSAATGSEPPEGGATPAAPEAEMAAVAQPESEPKLRAAPAATDPDVTLPTTDRAPVVQTVEAKSPVKATPDAPPSPTMTAASTPQSTARPPAPLVSQAPPAPIAPPASPTVLTQAEAPADVPAEPEVTPQQPAARNAKSDAARSAPHAGRAAPTGETVLPTAVTAASNASSSGKAASAVETDSATPRAAVGEAAIDAPDTTSQPAPAPAAPPAHLAAPAAHATQVRATPETVAHLAAHISGKLENHSTKFDIELNPAGLGRVSVSVEIAASGKMTAAMSFDNPQAAAELRGRSNEIQRALEQAGFDLSGGLSFDVAGDRGDGRGAPQQQQSDGAAWRGRAFQAVLGTAGDVVESASSLALNHGRRPTTGVDVRI